MKRVLIIIPFHKAIKAVFLFSGLLFLSAVIFISFKDRAEDIRVLEHFNESEYVELLKENGKLKGILGSLVPKKQNIIYENAFRNKDINALEDSKLTIDYTVYPLKDVIKNGEKLPCHLVYDDPKYLRPLYDPAWKDFYFRSWIDVPDKIVEAKHRLFTYYGGASNIFDFEGSLGFSAKDAAVDYHRNINFLIYKFNVRSVRMYKHQIVLTGEPALTGVQIVAIKLKDVLPESVDNKDFLFQLSTPEGYEIDYEYGNYGKTEYYKKLEKEASQKQVYTFSNGNDDVKELLKENEKLKEKLSYYIPLRDEIITEDNCRMIPQKDTHNILEKAREVKFEINYINKDYKRPVYHPRWEKNYERGWSYLPKKVCQGFHRLFIIPDNSKQTIDFFGNLAFFEEFKPVRNDEVGILVYDFEVQEVRIFNNQIMLIGRPSRSGAQIITLSRYKIKLKDDNIIKLVTPDNQELDYDILKENKVSYI